MKVIWCINFNGKQFAQLSKITTEFLNERGGRQQRETNTGDKIGTVYTDPDCESFTWYILVQNDGILVGGIPTPLKNDGVRQLG